MGKQLPHYVLHTEAGARQRANKAALRELAASKVLTQGKSGHLSMTAAWLGGPEGRIRTR